METLLMRKGTQDLMAYREVYVENQYRLPKDFLPKDVILDIGAQCGYFAAACLQRGAGHVICVEPDPDNCKLLHHNLDFASKGDHSRYTVLDGFGVWRGDIVEQVKYKPAKNKSNTCCGSCWTADGTPIETISLDKLIQLGLDKTRYSHIRFAKIDCEGAEYPALYTSKEVGRIEELRVETHALNMEMKLEGTNNWCCHAGMVCFLQDIGFQVSCEMLSPTHPNTNMLLFAFNQEL